MSVYYHIVFAAAPTQRDREAGHYSLDFVDKDGQATTTTVLDVLADEGLLPMRRNVKQVNLTTPDGHLHLSQGVKTVPDDCVAAVFIAAQKPLTQNAALAMQTRIPGISDVTITPFKIGNNGNGHDHIVPPVRSEGIPGNNGNGRFPEHDCT